MFSLYGCRYRLDEMLEPGCFPARAFARPFVLNPRAGGQAIARSWLYSLIDILCHSGRLPHNSDYLSKSSPHLI